MIGKPAKAPCGHDGETVCGNYVQCLEGCDRAVPEPVERETTEPMHRLPVEGDDFQIKPGAFRDLLSDNDWLFSNTPPSRDVQRYASLADVARDFGRESRVYSAVCALFDGVLYEAEVRARFGLPIMHTPPGGYLGFGDGI